MRFVQYFPKNGPRKLGVGVRAGDSVVPLEQVPGLPTFSSVVEMLQLEDSTILGKVQKFVQEDKGKKIPISEVELTSPITRPEKVLCVGLNYKDHCEETNMPIPVEPVIFNKFPSSICGPYDDIPHPKVTETLDFEVELAFVIGKSCRNVPKDKALDCVFGYTVSNDVSAREWQLKKNGGQWLLGKTMAGFCPLGPELVTSDEVGNAQELSLRCILNGKVVQNSTTAQMVHQVDGIVAFVSRFFKLVPGDVVLTGTPPGVGFTRNPMLVMKPGDVVECEIEKLGKITNKIVEETDN